MLRPGLYDVPAGHLAMVVTHLECTAPPEGPAAAADAETVPWAPDPAAYRDLFRAVGTPWLWAGHLMRPEAELAALLADPAYETFRMMRGDKAFGLLDLDFRAGDSCELAYFGLVPAAVGGGLGRALMRFALTRAFARVPRVTVHTCTLDHPAALGFYVAAGFRPLRREVEIMPDPRGTLLPEGAAPGVPRL